MLEALGWGAIAASSLVLGAVLAFAWRWPTRLVGSVLAFGAGALISAISFDLAEEGITLGGLQAMGAGLALGALTYYVLDGLVEGRFSGGEGVSGQAGTTNVGTALALGAFLDGVPEQMVLGIGVASGGGISISLLAAIFVSNLPEAIGSATNMTEAGTRRSSILRLWLGVAAISVLASGLGFAVAENVSGEFKAAVNGFAAGALIVMLVDSMIPEAVEKGGRTAGLLTTLGFAAAVALGSLE